MHCLVIGGTGFLGRHLVQQAVARGHTVTVLHRGTTPADLPEAVQHVHLDRDALTTERTALRALGPDVVIDAIPYTKAHAEAAVDVFHGVADRLAVVSSSDVYRNYDGWRGANDHDPDPTPLREDAPLRDTRYPYRGLEGLDFAYAHDYDKICVEETARQADLPTTILRLPAVYGPGDAQHRLGDALQKMDAGASSIVLSQAHAAWRWTHGYVENVASAVVHAALHPDAAGRTYNVGEVETPTAADRIRQLARVVGWDGEIEARPEADLPPEEQTPYHWEYDLATDTRRIRTDLGVEPPVSRDEALRRTVQWERTGTA